ncbi:MAG: agmatinase [Bacillota bacterium]
MLNRNVETFLGCDKEYADANIVIFGAPFDSTTSFRPGARFASKAMRSESFGIETYSPYLDKDLNDIAVFDGGDLELAFGSAERALAQIENYAAKVLKDGKMPLMIGGEHLVTLGAVRAAFEMHPELHIVHFDAHCDLRDEYLGVEISHATVMRRCWDLVGDGRIYQFGIRSGDRAEFSWARGGGGAAGEGSGAAGEGQGGSGMNAAGEGQGGSGMDAAGERVHMRKFDFGGLSDVVEKIGGKPVYLTIDLDVLDPSTFPGTGTPEAGGVGFLDLIAAISEACRLNVVACDVNELSPVYDQSGVSTAVACKVLRELLLSLNL